MGTTSSDGRCVTGWERDTVNLGMMQYSLYAALGVCCTLCQLSIIAGRYTEGWLNVVFLGDGRVEDEKEGDQRNCKIIIRILDLREFHIGVSWPSKMLWVWVPIWWVITLIRSLLNQIRQVIRLISHVRSYAPHCSHFFHHLSHHCLLLNYHRKIHSMINHLHCSIPWLWVDTEYSKQQVQHTASTA
jgi:hypothetical protein